MADPLSVPGRVVGIISLDITVTQGLVDFYSAARNQKSQTACTAGKLSRLLDLLETLQKQLANRKFRLDERDLVDKIEGSIHACDELIHELQAENDKFRGGSSHKFAAAALTTTRRVTYPFRQSTLQKLDEDVDESISHVSLALRVLQQRDVGSTKDDVEDAKSLLELVRADQVSSSIRDWLRAPDASIEYKWQLQKETLRFWALAGERLRVCPMAREAKLFLVALWLCLLRQVGSLLHCYPVCLPPSEGQPTDRNRFVLCFRRHIKARCFLHASRAHPAAVQPLTVSELVDAIAVELGDPLISLSDKPTCIAWSSITYP